MMKTTLLQVNSYSEMEAFISPRPEGENPSQTIWICLWRSVLDDNVRDYLYIFVVMVTDLQGFSLQTQKNSIQIVCTLHARWFFHCAAASRPPTNPSLKLFIGANDRNVCKCTQSQARSLSVMWNIQIKVSMDGVVGQNGLMQFHTGVQTTKCNVVQQTPTKAVTSKNDHVFSLTF